MKSLILRKNPKCLREPLAGILDGKTGMMANGSSKGVSKTSKTRQGFPD
jgi:hypothetical protein